MSLLHTTRDDLQIATCCTPPAPTDRPERGRGFAAATPRGHFRVLREAGVTDQREEGTARLNSLRREYLDARFPGLPDAVLASAGAEIVPLREQEAAGAVAG